MRSQRRLALTWCERVNCTWPLFKRQWSAAVLIQRTHAWTALRGSLSWGQNTSLSHSVTTSFPATHTESSDLNQRCGSEHCTWFWHLSTKHLPKFDLFTTAFIIAVLVLVNHKTTQMVNICNTLTMGKNQMVHSLSNTCVSFDIIYYTKCVHFYNLHYNKMLGYFNPTLGYKLIN